MVERIIDFSARNRFIVFLLIFGLAMAGWWALQNTPIDAIPDISDTQVIIYTTWMGRSPDLVEDQITYPIVTALLSAPRVTVVRGFSDFGFSYVYVLFKDGTDIYWARSRVLEYMNQLAGRLPEGVTPQLGPDATAVGWVFQYALVDESGEHDLRSALLPGLVLALLAPRRGGGRGSRQRRRLRASVSGEPGPHQSLSLSPVAA